MDSTRPPPPPSGPPPPYAFVTRVYKRSLRPIVLVICVVSGIWTLFSGIGFFRSIEFYSDAGSQTLKILSIVLGTVYMFITAVQAYGFFVAISQKLGLARIFAWLAVFCVVLIAAIGLSRTVIHFSKKDEIISICTEAADGASFTYVSGFWGPVRSGALSRSEAASWCQRAWERGSWSEIVAFIATTLLAAFFTTIALGYYRQLLDPSSVQNVTRIPASAIRTDYFPSHYAPPYNAQGGAPAPYPTYGGYPASNTGNNASAYPGPNPLNTPGQPQYSAYPAYGPPPGPPPAETKPPGYEGYGWSGTPADDKDGNTRSHKNPFDDDDGPRR